MTDLQPAIERLRWFNAMTAPQYASLVEGDFDDDLTTVLDALENANTTLAEDLRYQRRLEAQLARIEERVTEAQIERDDLSTRLSDFLCDVTGGALSRDSYSVMTMVQATETYFSDYYEKEYRALESRADAAEAKLARIAEYAREREAYGKRGRTVHSARIASDLLAILNEGKSA
jgi:hypothetical protein